MTSRRTALMGAALWGFAAVAHASSGGGTPATDLLVNGSFELPGGSAVLPGGSSYLTGWTTALSGVEYFSPAGWGGAADGVMAIDLANYTFTHGAIEQQFATVAGQRYDVAFSLGTLALFGRDGTAHVDVTLDGQTRGFDVVNPGSLIVWAPVVWSFTASAANTTLRFQNDQDPYLHFAYVDGVSAHAVSAVPEPEQAMLWLAGLVMLALRRGRHGGRTGPTAVA